MIQQGWKFSNDPDLHPYQWCQVELSLQQGRVLQGDLVVVPVAGHSKVLALLQEGHPGISRMKSLARETVWWPAIDQDLESTVNECIQCQTHHKSPPLHPWEWPQYPRSRLHIDYAGPIHGRMYLVVVDAHSKWIKVAPVPSADSKNTIEKLRAMFATHGIDCI